MQMTARGKLPHRDPHPPSFLHKNKQPKNFSQEIDQSKWANALAPSPTAPFYRFSSARHGGNLSVLLCAGLCLTLVSVSLLAASLLSLMGLPQRVLCHRCLSLPLLGVHVTARVSPAGSTSPHPRPSIWSLSKRRSPPAGSPGQGVGMCFWLWKHRVKLVSQGLTPSSAVSRSPGGRRSFLCVPSLSSTWDGTPAPLLLGPGQQTRSWDLLHSLISEDAWVQR